VTPEQLAREHYAYALRLYARYVRTLPGHIDQDAIRSAALEGLWKAARSYNGTTRVPFKNWSARRVIGQMRDEMRAQDHLSRRMRERLKGDEENKLKASPDLPVSLDELVAGGHDGETITYSDVVSDTLAAEESIWEEASRLSEREVHRLMAELSESELRVVVMRYYENMLVQDVAKAMGVSESRVLQIETQALNAMRAAIAEVTPLAVAA